MSLAACSRNADKDLASGDASFTAGKYSEAVIYYRNAIQVNPKLARAHYQLAQAYLRLKSASSAFAELQRTVELTPENSEAQLQLASLLISGKKYADAKAAADKVLAADPNNARAHGILGDRLALTGDPAGAIREYRTAIKLDPRRVESYFALGAIYGLRGELSDAESAFRQAVEANPQSEPARLGLARFYISRKNFATAEAELRIAAKLAPRDPSPLLMLADAYLAQDNRVEAEKICIQLKGIAPDNPAAYRALATFYESTRQREKTLAELESLRSSKPKDFWVKASLGETLMDFNRFQEASVLIQELLAADVSDPRALTLQGRILLSERKYPEAQATLEKAVKGADRSAAAWYYLGVAQQFSGLSDLSRASFAKARQLSPGTIGPQVALAEIDANKSNYEEADRLVKAAPNVPQVEAIGARAELARGNVRKAEEMVQAELARDPSSIPALEILLKSYAREGRLPEATSRLSALVSQYPQNPGLELLLARAYLEAKDWAGAEARVRRALALDPQLQDAHALLATIDSAQGLTGKAIAEFRTEIEAHPYKDANYLALASAYEAEGKWRDAISTLEKARAAGADSPYVNNNLAWLYLEHGGDTNAALSLAQEARRSLPDSPLAAGTLGWAFYKTGAYQPAITQLSLSTHQLPDNPENQYHLGMAYLGVRRFELAAQSFERALKIDPGFADAEGAKAALETIAKKSRK